MDITIIIPVYNRKDYIRKTVESLGTGYPLVLVDNGSTDGSLDVCKKIAAERPNTILAIEKTRGAAAARNKGLSLCTTKWVYFFDSDDIFTGLPVNWNEDADMVCIPTRQEISGKLHTRAYYAVSSPHVQVLSSMLNTLSMIFRTDYLRRIGAWNTSCVIWDDWELGLRALLQKPKVEWITSQAFHVIKIHPDSITGNGYASRTPEILYTLGVAFDDIYNMVGDDRERKKAFAALFYRCYIVSGQMQREGSMESSAEVRRFIYDRFRVNKQSHRMGRLFEWAASKGVRGLWRIALHIV